MDLAGRPAQKQKKQLTLEGGHVDVPGRGHRQGSRGGRLGRRRRACTTASSLKKGGRILRWGLGKRGGRGRGLGRWWNRYGRRVVVVGRAGPGTRRTRRRPSRCRPRRAATRHEAGLEDGLKAGDEGAQVVVDRDGGRGDRVFEGCRGEKRRVRVERKRWGSTTRVKRARPPAPAPAPSTPNFQPKYAPVNGPALAEKAGRVRRAARRVKYLARPTWVVMASRAVAAEVASWAG